MQPNRDDECDYCGKPLIVCDCLYSCMHSAIESYMCPIFNMYDPDDDIYEVPLPEAFEEDDEL